MLEPDIRKELEDRDIMSEYIHEYTAQQLKEVILARLEGLRFCPNCGETSKRFMDISISFCQYCNFMWFDVNEKSYFTKGRVPNRSFVDSVGDMFVYRRLMMQDGKL